MKILRKSTIEAIKTERDIALRDMNRATDSHDVEYNQGLYDAFNEVLFKLKIEERP